MTPASEEILDLTPPCPENSGDDGVVPGFKAPPQGFLFRQLSAAGLVEIAGKVAGGGELELPEALALSRASLPLLGKIVELRPVASDGIDISVHEALPIERVASLPESPRNVGQVLTDWESFCRALIALRSDFSPRSAARSWYPILAKPLDRDDGCEGGFSGAEVLRAIALARLILPAGVEIMAPLATLGPKLAQVALNFGASHLGYVALDGQPSSNSLLADPSVLDELMESISETEL